MNNHAARTLLIMGRLKPGVSIEQAQHEMTSIAGELARRVPKSNKGWSVSVEPLQNNFMSASRRTTLWLLLAAVGFVVAIACVNVANLLLARGTVREREMAIRASLGASRGRMIRQVLTESLVLAAAGGLLGILSGAWLLEGLLAVFPRGTLPSEADPHLSVPVLLFAVLTTTVCGLLFGSAPAWQASRIDLNETLKQSGRTSAGSGRRRLRQGLVLVELALAVTSLAGAGLAIHSFWNRTQVDLGVRTEHTLTFSLPVTREQLSTPRTDRSLLSATARAAARRARRDARKRQQRPAAPGHAAGHAVPSRRHAGVRDDVLPGHGRANGDARLLPDVRRNDRAGPGLHGQRQGRRRPGCAGEPAVRGSVPARRRTAAPAHRAERAWPPAQPKPGPLVEWQIVGVFHTINNSQQLGDVNGPEVDAAVLAEPLARRGGGGAHGGQPGRRAEGRRRGGARDRSGSATRERPDHDGDRSGAPRVGPAATLRSTAGLRRWRSCSRRSASTG